MFWKFLFLCVCAICFFVEIAFAGAQFKDHPLVLPLQANQKLELPLRDLLADVGNGTLTWTLRTNPPSWFTLDLTQEKLIATPLRKHAGDHEFYLSVTDGTDSGDINKVILRVFFVNTPPYWTASPLDLGTILRGHPFAFDLKPFAADVDTDPTDTLSFSLVQGPDWMTVSSDGLVSGTPPTAGEIEATFQVSDGTERVQNWGVGRVERVLHRQTSDNIKPNPGARVEVLWAIEHGTEESVPGDPSEVPTPLAYNMKNNIQYFFPKIKSADIHLSSALFRTEAVFSQGDPIPGADGSLLSFWDNPNSVADFQYRLSTANFIMWPDNSPALILHRFFEKAPTLPIYQQGILDPGVPLYIFMATTLTDLYRRFVNGTPIEHYQPADFGKYYIEAGKKLNKPIKFFSIGMSDSKVIGGADWNMPKILASTMKGQFTRYNDLKFRMRKTLENFADQIIWDNATIKIDSVVLDYVPFRPGEIQVLFKGSALASTHWHFDAEKNAVVLHWDLFDPALLHPGDLIEIEYEI